MLSVRILGCGTSSGVPRLGSDWGTCDPEEPRNRRTRASILVSTPTIRILVDTGPDMREQLLAAGTSDIGAVLWTHDHADHCHGLDDLRQVAQIRREPVRAYGHPATLALLRARFGYAFEGRAFYPPIIEAAPLPEGALTLGDVTVRSVAQPHGEIHSMGFRFDHGGRSIGYSTDFHAVTPEMTRLFAGVDIWVVDALRERPHPTHAHVALTLAAIADVAPGRAILTHMDTSMDYATLIASLPAGVEPAYDGLSVALARTA